MFKFIMGRIDSFLFFLNLIYLSAFSSLFIQYKGLYGCNGILPARIPLANNPSLLINYVFPKSKSHDEDLNLLIILGIIISSLGFIFKIFRNKLLFFSLWILYFSIYQIGQTFLWFQWDILLLETGIIAIILPQYWIFGSTSDYTEGHPSAVAFWLVKWLIFRLMFASGVVKLTSNCPTWWGLTALNWHYESQCIPTFLAWFVHQLPHWFHSLCVVATYFIEIMIPILFFVPIRPLQWFCFVCQIKLQIMIILSGNYNFFNILTMVLCISLLPRSSLPLKSAKTILRKRIFCSFENVISVVILSWFFYQLVRYFGIEVDTSKYMIITKIMFSRKEFSFFLEKFVPITIYIGAFSLFFEIIRMLMISIKIKGVINQIRHVVGAVLISLIVIWIFCGSLVPYTSLESKTNARLPKSIKRVYESMNRYEIVNSYGLFRSMTGVGGRPEIIIEGSNNIQGAWKEYEFLYKPGNLSRAAPFIIPHQPRLDWQMWFAALGSYQHNPWLINLLYRILTDEKSVIQLLERNPFPYTPPSFVRVKLYTYHYTNYKDKVSSNAWWKRDFIEDYLPPISLRSEGLMEYINENNLNHQAKNDKVTLGMVKSVVRLIMDNLNQSYSHVFVWTIILLNIFIKVLLEFL